MGKMIREWTQDKLAEKDKVSKFDISRFENRRSIPYKPQAKRLAEVLEITENKLL